MNAVETLVTTLLGTQNALTAKIASGDPISVRSFDLHEGMSTLFQVDLSVLAKNAHIDFAAVVGKEASFTISPDGLPARVFRGVIAQMAQVAVEDAPGGLSSYQLMLVPKMWLLSQRRNHRMFQRMSEPEIVSKILGEWGVEHELRLTETYKKREYRVQYAESDFAFVSRTLEEAGITYFFQTAADGGPLVLTDAPEKAEPRAPLPYVNEPNMKLKHDLVTDLRVGRRTKPGRYVQADWDFRVAATLPLRSEAESGLDVEQRLERYHYAPNALHFVEGPGASYPVGDQKGKFRRDMDEGDKQAERRLLAKQGPARTLSFVTTALELRPADVLSLEGHPRSDVSAAPLLVVASTLRGEATGEWSHECEARYADQPFKPPMATPRPRVMGLEPATVVGPKGEEIHVDEFGRVKVHFHWDRESKRDDESSVWIPVSHPWAGKGFGLINHPRVGHEVIVSFLCGDPDQPVIVGRLHTAQNPVIYALPEHKTKSGWRSRSTPQGEGFNELMFEDKKGEELVRLQAELDFTALVKRDSGVVIRRDSMSHVNRHETHTVIGDQTTRVKQNRRMRVEQIQAEFIDKDIFEQSIRGSTVRRAKKILWNHASEAILLSVSPSRVGPDDRTVDQPIKSFIKIEANKIT
ncbi:MAG: type VI secretion system tip protein VgrG, partial [Myxococcales bacterium]|nr:type VI secretion system tip protein VgrG [Myxococcales bacterium]